MALAFAAAAVISLWVLPIRSCLWLDECVTFWVGSRGPGQIFSRSLVSLQSPLTSLITWIGTFFIGPLEIGTRIPALAAMTIAAVLFYRLAAAISDVDTASISVAIFACSPYVAFHAVDARPYAFALAGFLGAVHALRAWLISRKWKYALLFAVLSSATVHFQFLFLYSYAVYAAFAVWEWRCGRRVVRSQVVAAVLAICVFLLPLAPYFQKMVFERRMKSFAPSPTVDRIFECLFPEFSQFVLLVALAAGIAAGILMLLVRGTLRRDALRVSREGLVILAAAIAVPVTAYLVAGTFGNVQLFLPRYMVLTAPSVCFLLALGFRALPRIFGVPAIIAFLALHILFLSTNPYWSHHQDQDWKGASQLINRTRIDGPVLLRSGLPEASHAEFLTGPEYASYMRAPFSVYPVSKPTIPLPFRDVPESRTYIAEIYYRAAPHDSFMLINDGGGADVLRAVAAMATQDGFSAKKIEQFGYLSVWRFDKSQPAFVRWITPGLRRPVVLESSPSLVQ